MKRCSRCGHGQLNLVRQDVKRRGRRHYAMAWYRCPECQEINFSYRMTPVAPALEAIGPGLNTDHEPEIPPVAESSGLGR